VPAQSQISAEAIGRGDPLAIDLQALLNPEEKAVTFLVERVGGIDFLVKPGDTIDIVLTAQVSVLQPTVDSAQNTDPNAPVRLEPVAGLEDARTVKAIMQDKRVLYVSATRATQPEPVDSDGDGVPDAEQPAQPVIDSVIIVFAGTAQDQEVMRFAQRDISENGALSVVVRHGDDDEIETTLGITIDQLVEVYGLRIPGIVEELNEDETAP